MPNYNEKSYSSCFICFIKKKQNLEQLFTYNLEKKGIVLIIVDNATGGRSNIAVEHIIHLSIDLI